KIVEYLADGFQVRGERQRRDLAVHAAFVLLAGVAIDTAPGRIPAVCEQGVAGLEFQVELVERAQVVGRRTVLGTQVLRVHGDGRHRQLSVAGRKGAEHDVGHIAGDRIDHTTLVFKLVRAQGHVLPSY